MAGQDIAVHLQKCQPVFLELKYFGPDLRRHLLLKLDRRMQFVADLPDRPVGFQHCPKCCIPEPGSCLLQEQILGEGHVGRCPSGVPLLELFID